MISSLDLEGNKIGTGGGLAVARMMFYNKSLRVSG